MIPPPGVCDDTPVISLSSPKHLISHYNSDCCRAISREFLLYMCLYIPQIVTTSDYASPLPATHSTLIRRDTVL